MRIFLSWSGDKSKRVAEALKEWLVLLFPTLDVWLSSDDIKAGDRWARELSERLEETSFGILCLTETNLNSPWILYEAGALSKSIAAGKIVPYLIDIDYSSLPDPIAHFQAVKADKEGTRKLVQTISSVLPNNHRPDQSIERIFNLCWADLEALFNDLSGSLLISPSNQLPKVQFRKSEGTNVNIEGTSVNLSQKEYALYLFLAYRSANNAASFPYYKAAIDEFKNWIEHDCPTEARKSWLYDVAHHRIWKVMPNVISGIRKKFARAGLDKLEEYLLPHKGRIGIKVQLESDLSAEGET